MEDKKVSENKITALIHKFLNQNYEKEIPGAQEMANEYLKGAGTLNDKVDRLIKNAMAKTSAAGFVSGVGGLITLPIAIPGDIIVTAKVQVRMILAIALMGENDVESDAVKTFVRTCILGDIAKDTATDVGIKIGNRAALKLMTKVGPRAPALLSKVLTKSVPVLCGIVGGTVNGVATRVIGNLAKRRFL